jgi:hypothetical protein
MSLKNNKFKNDVTSPKSQQFDTNEAISFQLLRFTKGDYENESRY